MVPEHRVDVDLDCLAVPIDIKAQRLAVQVCLGRLVVSGHRRWLCGRSAAEAEGAR